MKAIKVLILIVSFIVGIILCLVLITNLLGYRSNIANGITRDEIKKIEIGMTFEDVISILGNPYEIDVNGNHHDLSCKNLQHGLAMSIKESADIKCIVNNYFNNTIYCCEGNREARKRFGKNVILTYSKPVHLSKYYPMLWVHLDSNYCVCNVYAKRKNHIKDITIYSLSWKKDEMTGKDIPDEISLFINDEIFNNCFKFNVLQE